MSKYKTFMLTINWKVVLCAAILLQLLNIASLTFGRIFRGHCISDFLLGGKASDYQSPVMLCLAVSIFLLFMKIKWPQRLGRMCLLMGPSMFIVYLLHDGTNPMLAREFFCHIEKSLGFWIGMPLAAVIIYIGCTIVDCLRRMLLSYGSKLNVRKVANIFISKHFIR